MSIKMSIPSRRPKLAPVLLEDDHVLVIGGLHKGKTGRVKEVTPDGKPLVVFKRHLYYALLRRNVTLLARKNIDHLRGNYAHL